jgi:hypothetical protein
MATAVVSESGSEHNPWLLVEPISGLTHYQIWNASLEPGEFERLIEDSLPSR